MKETREENSLSQQVLNNFYLAMKAIELRKENPQRESVFYDLVKFHSIQIGSLLSGSIINIFYIFPVKMKKFYHYWIVLREFLLQVYQNRLFFLTLNLFLERLCVLINEKNEIFLQQRISKFLDKHWEFPGRHQRAEETGRETAMRETKEEIMLDTDPHYLAEVSFTDDATIQLAARVYISMINTNEKTSLNPKEVRNFQFISFDDLKMAIDQDLIQVTPITKAIFKNPETKKIFQHSSK